MNESSKQEQDRWRELHEMLGLPTERPADKPAPPPPAPAEPSGVEDAEYAAAESPLPDVVEDVESSPPAPDVGMADDDDRSLPPLEEEEIPEALDEESALPPPGPARDESRGDDDDRPRRGRRRGRRGRRPRRDDVAPERIDTDDTEVEPAGEDVAAAADHLGEDLPDETSLEEDLAESPAEPAAQEEDDEPVETFADWNVPSWQEIVASLYRPER